jgi:large subunit ribosomal protein L23
MALFGSKKKSETKPEAKAAAPATKQAASNSTQTGGNFAHVLKNPRITEKASMHQGVGVYTFDVDTRATKQDIAAAVRATYKVSPRKVRIVVVPSKMTRSMKTGRTGVKSGGKKAYVYLKNGETISIS